MSNWVEGQVKEIKWWTDSLFSLILNADVEPFTAGQFTKLALQVDDKRIARAYSYVNAPSDPNLEFYLINVAEGLLSPQLAKLKAGDTLMIERHATGFFTVDELPASEQLLLLSTGTAIGPYLSMLVQGDVWQKYQHVHLVHGVRCNADLSYQDKIKQLQAVYPQLIYTPVVSRESANLGLNGRVTEVIKNNRLFDLMPHCVTPSNTQFMICGNPQMVKDTTALLLDRGFTRHRRREPGNITVEQYW
ncbi:ferredoxin--NADP reductase [Pseudoalteromonas mariniglutinosa]|uniref:ferredoxin--NADP reductase n=1 Tax=Pseudoalteromonas mariniglutinosa TaxID=206042 RepID=UPI00384DDE8F